MAEAQRSAGLSAEQAARSFAPAHPDLPHAGGVAAQAGSESYVEALARVVFYWAYPGVDTFGRTNVWQIMAGQRGTMLGILPGAERHVPVPRRHPDRDFRTDRGIVSVAEISAGLGLARQVAD